MSSTVDHNNFDNPPSRVGTDSIKYGIRPYKINENVPIHPHWHADMDFKSCEPIVNALESAARYGIYGYPTKPKDLNQIVTKHLASQGWNLDVDEFDSISTFSPGVIAGLGIIIHALTNPGEAVMFHTPAYPRFFDAVNGSGRKLVMNPLVQNDNGWTIDFEDFEKKIVDNQVKIFLLCSPHNPTGRVWSKDELTKTIAICKKHNVYLMCDEIHCDLTLYENHIHTATLPDAKDRCITLLSPSKTFNVPGLVLSLLIAENKEVMKKIQTYALGNSLCHGNLFGFVGMKTAYSGVCQDWLDYCKDYLRSNVEYCVDFLHKNLPTIGVRKPQGTFLLWMDMSGYKLSSEEMDSILGEKGVILNHGGDFGEQYKLFRRFNYATSRKEVETVMNLIHEVFSKYEH
ncbi:cysteine-S-conjugate beta-lyase [Entamoeba marina]